MSFIVKYFIVVFVYNEEEVIYEIYCCFIEVMYLMKEVYEFFFVNDGSRDWIVEIIKEYSE